MFLHVNYISSGDIIKEYELDNEYREFCVVDNYLIISNTEEIVKIDINTGKVVGEIEALKDYAGGRTSIFSSKEDIIYLVNKSGMYSYSIKNDTITEVISGENASIGTEKYALDIFLPKNNNEFLALYYEPEKDENKYSLKNYYYSEGGNENGENEITVYSVYKNEALSEAISLYNVKNPKTTIKYEVGVSGDNAVTESDALRVLNTEIIAGNGPTVIVLDDIPIDNYIEKGLLQDISNIISPLVKEDKLYSNILTAYSTDNKIFAVPTSFKIPMIIGDNVNNINDMDSFADYIEEIGKKSDSNIMNIHTPEEIVNLFYPYEASNWINKDNSINEDEVRSFLQNSKRIYYRRDYFRRSY